LKRAYFIFFQDVPIFDNSISRDSELNLSEESSNYCSDSVVSCKVQTNPEIEELVRLIKTAIDSNLSSLVPELEITLKSLSTNPSFDNFEWP